MSRNRAERFAVRFRVLAAACPLALAAGLGCSSPRNAAGAVPPAIPPWTQEFEQRALLIADKVRIEGPVGLLDHLATRPNPEFHDRSERTTPDGFLQEIESRVTGKGSEILAWLDKLEIVALHELSVLEGPFLKDVVVEASGQVLWRPIDGEGEGAERRESPLRLVGRLPEWSR